MLKVVDANAEGRVYRHPVSKAKFMFQWWIGRQFWSLVMTLLISASKVGIYDTATHLL